MLLIKLMKKHGHLVLLSLGISGIAACITLWWNAVLSSIIDEVSAGKRISVPLLSASLVLIALTSLFGYTKTLLSGYTCECMAHSLRMGYARYLNELPFTKAEQLNAGEQFSKLQNEISDISDYLTNHLFSIIDDSIRFLFTLSWLLSLNAKLTILTNLPVLAIMLYIVWSSQLISSATKDSQQAKGNMNQYADSLLTLFPVIRLYDAAQMLLNGYQNACGEWENKARKAEKVRARLMSLSGLLTAIPLILLFMLGGSQVINRSMSIGILYLFLNLSGNVSGIMMNMPGHIAAFRQFLANMQRISPNVILVNKGDDKNEPTY